MNQVISFGLWGENLEYLNGALTAIESARSYFPNWNLWFYIREDVPKLFLNQISAKGARLIPTAYPQEYSGMALRFLPASDPSVDVMLCRDVDSLFTFREASAVNEWLSGHANFHIIRDHPDHILPIMGGLWGCRKGAVPEMRTLIQQYKRFSSYGSDQKFLARHVYPKIVNTSCIHSEIVQLPKEKIRVLPIARSGIEFIGRANRLDCESAQDLAMKRWIDAGRHVRTVPNIYTLPGRIWLILRRMGIVR